jgi:hypothetical protein
LRLEYAWKAYAFALECSDDGQIWKTLADYTVHPAQGSPLVIEATGRARYLRLVFLENKRDCQAAVFEWAVE